MVTGTVFLSSARIADSGTSFSPASSSERDIGIDRHQEVLAARFDAMAGIVDDGDVGAFGVLDEAFEVAAQLARIAVVGDVGLETETVEHLLDGARIVLGIGQLGDVLVVGLADDQRHAAQFLAAFSAGEAGDKDGGKRQDGGEQRLPQPNCLAQKRPAFPTPQTQSEPPLTQGDGSIMAGAADA